MSPRDFRRNNTPKIGDVFVARGDIGAMIPGQTESVWEGTQPIVVPMHKKIPNGSYVVLMDVVLRTQVFPGVKRESICYKVLSMSHREVLYVEVYAPAQGRPIDIYDYQAACHSWYLSFDQMSSA